MDQNKINNITSTYFKSDQLHHILKIDGVELCLVCKKIVNYGQNISEFSDPLTNHLNSTLHKEEIKSLFELCNPDPLCNSSDTICVDIVNKSVFDISVLLGDETCYIYKKEGNLFCMLCQKSIIQIFKHIEVVKYAIFSHVKRNNHIEKIKEVCWVYPLNKEKDFLLFHKTVVHCTVCKHIVQCKDNTILQTVVYHLESDQHKYLTSKSNAMTDENFASQVNTMLKVEESADLIKEEYHILKCTTDAKTIKSEQFENKSNQDYIKSEIIANSYQLNRIELEISVNKDYVNESNNSKILNKDSHPNLNKIITDELKRFNESETEAGCLDEQGVEEEGLQDVIRTNQQYIIIQEKTCFCKLCNKYLSYTENKFALMNNLSQHFNGKPHIKSKLVYESTLKKSVNNIYNKNEMTLDACEDEMLEEVAGTTGSLGSNINKKFIGINCGISYCKLCWQEIKYSKNHNILTNRFSKHFKTVNHKTNEHLRLKNPRVIKKITGKNKQKLLQTIAEKKKQPNLLYKLEIELKKIELKKSELSQKEKKKLLYLRTCLKKFKKENKFKSSITNVKGSELMSRLSKMETHFKTNTKSSNENNDHSCKISNKSKPNVKLRRSARIAANQTS